MRIGIYTNKNRDIDGRVTAETVSVLKDAGVLISILDSAPSDVFSLNNVFLDNTAECDAIIAIGGDGTMLEIAKRSAIVGVPIVGINKGKLGFLSETNVGDIKKVVDALISGNYKIEKRFLISAKTADNRYLGVNDLVLSRRDHGLSSIEIFVNGTLCDKIKGDGVLVSTPTGSTAYSLSCGGPVISPELDVLLVIGICPHSLHSRPMVISGNSEILLRSEFASNTRLVIDGKNVTNYDGCDVLLTISDRVASFVRIGNTNFYEKLLDKMKYWSNL